MEISTIPKTTIKAPAKKKRDTFGAVWVSHSSMGDFLKCPRAYYLHNVYKDPKTRRKINVTSPALALGVSVHEVVEGLGRYSADKRSAVPMLAQFEEAWKKVSGKKGGFTDASQEAESKARGIAMIERVARNLGPLAQKTVKLKEGTGGMPPNMFLTDEDDIILCGKIDWLIYEPTDDSVHLLDFKTGKNEEGGESLQLPIYQLLMHNLQKRKVTGASYWYLDRDDVPVPANLPSVEESFNRVIEVARKVKAARDRATTHGPENVFICAKGSCFACRPFEKILRGEAEYVGVGEYNQDIYIA